MEAIVRQHPSVARVAEALAGSWNTANTAALDEGRRVLIDDPHRFDAVSMVGVDEHVWRYTHRGDTYVTAIIDLTPVRAGTGPARLLDMIEAHRAPTPPAVASCRKPSSTPSAPGTGRPPH